ncbi:MAG: hypothetical protein ACXWV3_08290 [Flavisolibacter sp.]
MKRLITIAALFISFQAVAQSKGKVNIYAYKEPVIGGAYQQNQIEEGGNKTEVEQKARFNYLIYLASEERVYPSEIWINGTAFSAGLESVNSPVTRQNFTAPGQAKMELVPLTSQKVIQLKPGPAITEKISKEGRDLSKSNELVVVYKQNGKFFYVGIPIFKILEPVALQ